MLNVSSEHSFKSTYFEECLRTTASLMAPVLESLLNKNKIAGLQASKFCKKRLQNRCFSVKFAKFLRTPILKNN